MTTAQSIYPETCEDALKLWDAGESLFTVEMGGLGPSYEYCIQALAFEIMRANKDVNLDDQGACQECIDSAVHRLNDQYRFSGAQVGAAANLAFRTRRVGYDKALREPAVKDRLIQIEKNMPEALK